MKKKIAILIAFLLMSISLYSQNKYDVKVYVPIRTYHYDRAPIKLNSYHPTEGGNIGAILIIRKDKTIYHDYQVGVIRNSFGDTSILISYGLGVKTGAGNIGINVGLMSGYEKFYEGYILDIPYGFKKYGILPSAVLNIEPNINLSNINWLEVKPLFAVSSTFINGGLVLSIK